MNREVTQPAKIRLSQSRRVRRAFTLMECMATLSVLMVMGIAASTLLSKVTQIGVQTNHDQTSRRMVLSLSRQLRTDLAAAQEVDLSDDGQTLALQQSGSTVKYRVVRANKIAAAAIERESRKEDQVVAAERYELPASCQPAFTQSDNVVSLRLTAPEQRNAWIIEAVKS